MEDKEFDLVTFKEVVNDSGYDLITGKVLKIYHVKVLPN